MPTRKMRFPFLTRGRPPRCADVRDIYLACTLDHEIIEEVSRREMETAFVVSQRVRSEFHAGYAKYKHTKHEDKTELLAFDGRLYRRIPADRPWSGLLGNAFDGHEYAAHPEPGLNLTVPQDRMASTVMSPLARQFEWQLDRESALDSRVVTAWPHGSHTRDRANRREAMDFREIHDSIEDIDIATQHETLRTIEAFVGRMLVVDGNQLWMECGAPMWRVSHQEARQHVALKIELAHGFDGFDCDLSRRYFALDDLEGAEQHAAQVARKRKGDKNPYIMSKAIPEFEVLDASAEAKDVMDGEVSRIGYALATECFRYARKHVGWVDQFSPQQRNSLLMAYHETLATNYVSGKMGNVRGHILDLCDIWAQTPYAMTYCTAGLSKYRDGKILLESAREIATANAFKADEAFRDELARPVGARMR
ncbi:hypothetical protein GOB57_22095 [Sinorhizobium meliloti]|nr:hypothetical protein [Sinorhizobium meliloti]